jgi:hypothetical protein
MSEVGAFQLIKQGNLRVEIHFAEALTATINVVIHAEFDNVIEIDRNKQVLFVWRESVVCQCSVPHNVLEYLSLHTGQVLSSICSVGQTLVK